MTFPEKPLSALGLTARNGANPRITGLAVDSRDVKPGHLFAAMPGTRVHGGEFITFALRMGAAAILTDQDGAKIAAVDLESFPDAALVISEQPRETLSRAAALFYGAQPDVAVAVTGTNGKTSVSTFVRQIWELLGLPGINIGTTGVEGAWTAPMSHTTPEPITLHKMLATAARNGITHAAMEASSHGLDQRRLDGVTLKAAGFTNFTQDHLDYHASFEDYFDAKAALFARVLPEEGTAVINLDDPRGVDMVAIASARGQMVMTIGTDAGDISILGQRFDSTGQLLRFRYDEEIHQVRLGLIGGFQAENVLMAAALVIAAGEPAAEVFKVLPELKTVRGRMELVATRSNQASVYVDYSHTPDAVETALKALRPHVMGKLVCVVGAGGDRDPLKRPMMGSAAQKNADVVYVTDDNPRTEDPASIRAAVMEGCPEATEVPDRAEAILRAIDALEPGDVALIAGKGHETGQVIGNDVLPFDDAEQASIAVAALDGGLA